MYPNPQDVLPLPPHPSLEQYRKRAKELVRASRSGDPASVRSWASQWIEDLARLRGEPDAPQRRREIARHVDLIDAFATATLTRGGAAAPGTLADAQLVIARAHGFLSWPKFAQHLEALARASSPIAAFEAAADAVIAGDVETLARLLTQMPDLARARSTREHRATLLHYVAANGVENYRQRTPKNAVRIADLLLASGAEVEADADVYGGGATALGLAATSVHPSRAGVQNDLIDLLLTHGARMDQPRSAGSDRSLIAACLANGRPEAAEHLGRRGAQLTLEGAAGLGRIDVVKAFFDEARSAAPPEEVRSAFAWACSYGRTDVAGNLLERGLDVDLRLRSHGSGHTGLHVAAFGGHSETVALLLRRGASVAAVDDTWGTTPLAWALYAWSQDPGASPGRYYETAAMLVAAGAVVKPEWLDDEPVRSDAKMLATLRGG